MRFKRDLLFPFSLSALIVALDQYTKALVVAQVAQGGISWSAFGDFFWLTHQRNLGIAFSIGYGMAATLRSVLFILLPLALVVAIVVYYFRGSAITRLQRWALCGIVGGGAGNVIDRIFRPQGVVDFLSFKFYGLLGMERWPTFNVADMSVVVCAVLLALSTLGADAKRGKS